MPIAADPGAQKDKLIGHWTFEKGEELKDLTGNFPDIELIEPGHGDIYRSLKESGILTELRNRGIKFMFISNSDNLGVTLDTSLLQYMVDTQTEFMMEVVEKNYNQNLTYNLNY